VFGDRGRSVVVVISVCLVVGGGNSDDGHVGLRNGRGDRLA